ncbi:MAG: methylated-DNA--[protein]-cysteine S-methyltransferase [Sphingomonadaceae bacterium]|nr:methylated-DNA--[protein]-cysteine S-methyltransferase [Sphingomonadaceae bacterium]
MSDSGFTLFETAIGRCGIAWRPEGLVGLHLPEANEAASLARLRRRFPGLDPAEPPPEIAAAIARITAFLAGGKDDFRDLVLDYSSLGAWDRSVYEEARAIPAGSTITYGTLAARTGDPGMARAVGQALGRNPWPIVVPCHRITAADGRTGGFSAPGGTATKLKLLEIEGALRVETLPLFGGAA